MILSKKEIQQAIKQGDIIALNYNSSQITTESIDVTLGEHIYFPEYKKWVNITSPLDIPKGEFFLAYTDEFIGSKVGSKLHTQFHLGSTPARLGLSHPVAGYGDEGFVNRWALEFYTLQPTTIQHRNVIGQISFTKKTSSSDYVGQGGYYQTTNDLDALVSNWKKESILPRPNLKLILK